MEETLNNEVNSEVGSSSLSTDRPLFDPDTQNIHKDLDDDGGTRTTTSAETKKTDTAGAGADKDGDDKGKANDGTGRSGEQDKDKGKKDPENVPYTRFKEVNDERKQLRLDLAKLQGQVELLSKGKGVVPDTDNAGGKTGKGNESSYTNILNMDEEEIAEKMSRNPKTFLADFAAQIVNETISTLDQQNTIKSKDQAVRSTYNKFAEKNGDFNDMWDAKEIQKYMEKHPGHNPMSAYHELTMEKRIQAAVDKATKDTEERLRKEFRSRSKAAGLTGGASSSQTQSSEDAELADTSKQGGVVETLVQRLRRMRGKAT